MTEKDLSLLTDQDLLEEAKKKNSSNLINALLIGFLIGIILYSAVKNTLGFLTLIPLYFIYKMVNKPNNHQELERLLKERGLKL